MKPRNSYRISSPAENPGAAPLGDLTTRGRLSLGFRRFKFPGIGYSYRSASIGSSLEARQAG
jgi:hypothetical protein